MKKQSVILSIDSLINQNSLEKGAIQYIEYLLRNEIPFYIIYEQCSRNKAQIINYLIKRGMPELDSNILYASSDAAIAWMLSKDNAFNKVVYIGGRGLKESIEIAHLQIDYRSPDAVLLGLNREVSYKDYNDVLQYILNGAKFISIDNRKTQIYEGITMIGNDAIVKMLECASDTRALKFGRGSEMLLFECLKHFGLDKENTIMISDEFYGDLLPAMNLGLKTILITNGQSIETYGFDKNYHPDSIAETYYGLIK